MERMVRIYICVKVKGGHGVLRAGLAPKPCSAVRTLTMSGAVELLLVDGLENEVGDDGGWEVS